MHNAAFALRLRSIFVWTSRFISPATLAAGGVLLITVWALFLRPYIGMADNGDFFRVLYSNGLYFNTPDYGSQYFGYFVREYGIYQYYNENGSIFSSSQSLFIHLAIWLNRLFHSGLVFDIRYLAAIYVLLYSAAIYLLVESMTWRISSKFGYPIALLAIFIFGDTAYTAYFNSFYSESIVLIMLLFVFASGLLLYRRRYNDYVLIGLFLFSALILTTSKQQNAPLGVILGLAGLFLLFIRQGRSYRIWTATAMTSLIIAGIATYTLIPQEFVNINKYHAMTRGALLNSPNPEQTLSTFGIDRQYALFEGSTYYDPYTTIDVNSKLLADSFYKQYGFASIMTYYLTHPDQAGAMLNLAAQHAFEIRPAAMGNYEKSEGQAFGKQTSFFSLYSSLKENLAPRTFGFIVIWGILVIGLYVPSFISAVKARNMRRAFRLPLLITMMLAGLSGIIVSIIGAGDADLAKHEFAFTVAFDLVTFLTVSDLLRQRLWRNDPADHAAPAPTDRESSATASAN